MNSFLQQLKGEIRELVVKVVAEWVADPPGANPWHRHGTVTGTAAGGVTVRWDGEDSATARVYPCLASYTSRTVSDRVFAVPSGKTWLVLGKVG